MDAWSGSYVVSVAIDGQAPPAQTRVQAPKVTAAVKRRNAVIPTSTLRRRRGKCHQCVGLERGQAGMRRI